MISYISGQMIENNEGVLTVLCRGLGYEVTCSQNTIGDIEGLKVIQLWIHTHVREDSLSLFGFSSQVEKKLFLSLIKVSGIGPKLAVQILSGAPLDQIIQAIEDKDIKALTRLPRVGKRTAEQMILTLKGDLVIEEERKTVVPQGSHKDILSALVNLGFRSAEVEDVVSALPHEIDFEQGVRESLRQISQ
ncbi:MAG: Holliday junction branch migration protein RuvA [Pseudomonadota bacterium]